MKPNLNSLFLCLILGSAIAEPAVFANASKASLAPLKPQHKASEKQHPTNFAQCGLSNKARQLAALIVQDSEQQRLLIRCNPLLARIAQEKAKEMAESGKVSHKGVDGGPNEKLIKAGYPLPKEEIERFNSVEAILGGESEAEDTWLTLQASFLHKTHLLGENPYYLNQTELGVAHYYKWRSPHIDYWVIYFAPIDKKEICAEENKCH